MMDHRAQLLLQALPYERQLKAFIRRHTRRGTDVEDVLQELYARLLDPGDGVTVVPIRSPRSFAFTVAKNLIIDLIRQHRPRELLTLSLDLMTDADQLEAALLAANVEEDVDAEQELQLLSAALADAPQRSRQVFVLRKVYGYKQEEIAQALNIKINTVQRHIGIAALKCAAYLCNAPGAPQRFSLLERFKRNRRVGQR